MEDLEEVIEYLELEEAYYHGELCAAIICAENALDECEINKYGIMAS